VACNCDLRLCLYTQLCHRHSQAVKAHTAHMPFLHHTNSVEYDDDVDDYLLTVGQNCSDSCSNIHVLHVGMCSPSNVEYDILMKNTRDI